MTAQAAQTARETQAAGEAQTAGEAGEAPAGRVRRLLPESRAAAGPDVIVRVLAHVGVLRSLYLSTRCRGACLVSRGTRVKLGRGARIEVPRGSFLFLGFAHFNPTPCAVHLGRGAVLAVRGTVQIHRGSKVFVHDGGRLELGPGSYLNDGSIVTCFEHIRVGARCSVSWNTNLTDTNVHELVAGGVARPRSRPVAIGDDVWIGAGATVLAGVSVGDGAVIGAAAVVTRDVPPAAVVAGNPARVIHREVTWTQ